MDMTTIAIARDVKDQLREFGSMGENYSYVILRLLKGARERRLQDFLLSEEGCAPIEDAIKRADEKWSK